MKKDGKLAMPAPSILFHDYNYLLTIGKFIEKCRHQILDKDLWIAEFLKALLRNCFQKVEEKQIVDITMLTASEPRAP